MSDMNILNTTSLELLKDEGTDGLLETGRLNINFLE